MNFQNLQKIETPQKYIDKILRITRETRVPKPKASTYLQKLKLFELNKLKAFREAIDNEFKRIQHEFPSIDELSRFYIELLRVYVDPEKVKKSLGAMKWVTIKNRDFYNEYSRKVLSSRTVEDAKAKRKEYTGRATSLIKKVKDDLALLEETRKVLRNFPDIKDCFTICIYGFPNIGKSTLLSKLTKAKPEIKPYAFTTKSINSGFIPHTYKEVQVLDVPGTLNRGKMNAIEVQAELTLKYLANAIVYIFDLTEPFPITDQLRLFGQLKNNVKNKEIIIYFSKKDLLGARDIEEFSKKQKIKTYYTDSEELKEKLLSLTKGK